MLKTMLRVSAIELTDGIESAVSRKIGGLDKYLAKAGTPQEVRIEITRTTRHHKKGDVYKVKADLKVARKTCYAEATSDDLYAAIDAVKDELKRKIDTAFGSAEAKRRRSARQDKKML